MEPEQEHDFHRIVESVGQRFQNNPLDIVNEDMLHPRLVYELQKNLSVTDLPAHLITEWDERSEWSVKWKRRSWSQNGDNNLGYVSRLRSEVCFPESGTDSGKRNYFDIVLFDEDQKRLELLSKSKGPGNWFSLKNDVELLAEVKHSKTSDEKDFYKKNKGIRDIQGLSQFPGNDIERVFVFASHYPYNHHKKTNRLESSWSKLEAELNENPDEFEFAVTIYHIPRKYDIISDPEIAEGPNIDLPIQTRTAQKINGKIELSKRN